MFLALLASQRLCVAEFGCPCRASDKCQREKRKTVNGDDLLWAMSTLGFEDYVGPLKVYLQRYREVRYAFTIELANCPLRSSSNSSSFSQTEGEKSTKLVSTGGK